MRNQKVIWSPVCLHLRVFTMINGRLSPHICVASWSPWSGPGPWLVSVYLLTIIPLSPHSPGLTLATEARPDQDLFTAVQGCQAPGENGAGADIHQCPLTCCHSDITRGWPSLTNGCEVKIFQTVIILSLSSSYLACHKREVYGCFVVLTCSLFIVFLALLSSWSHHDTHAPCDAPQVVVALGKITPLLIMFVARLPGIWASWQHHTLAGGVGLGTSHKWRE